MSSWGENCREAGVSQSGKVTNFYALVLAKCEDCMLKAFGLVHAGRNDTQRRIQLLTQFEQKVGVGLTGSRGQNAASCVDLLGKIQGHDGWCAGGLPDCHSIDLR